MTDCIDCRMLLNGKCQAHVTAKKILKRSLPEPPLGSCFIPIVERYISVIKTRANVLEIGCGTWDRIKNYCIENNIEYEGIDTQKEYFGAPTVATRIENLAKLSYPDNSFDIVLGNQTMEHWAEYGCTLEFGLYQCFRVCKPDGLVMMNVPIHFHGTKAFMNGDLEYIKTVFDKFSDNIVFEKWGFQTTPLPPYFPHPGYKKLENRPAYILDIQARKKSQDIPICTNRGALNGRLAQLLNYPISYNIFRLLRKIDSILT